MLPERTCSRENLQTSLSLFKLSNTSIREEAFFHHAYFEIEMIGKTVEKSKEVACMFCKFLRLAKDRLLLRR